VISSLAGATDQPLKPPGLVRVGGFGGASGLAAYLRAERIDFLIDATHPFAAAMQVSAAEAAAEAGVRRCRLLRPPWPRRRADKWTEVESAEAAARALAPICGVNGRVFLALGARGIAPFLPLVTHRFVLRGVSPPQAALPGNWEFIPARGPFSLAGELELFRQRRIDAVVARQSGGGGGYAKIEAAAALGLPVLMIRRPKPPPPPVLADLAQALDWLALGMK
jgi:precorrin-6A/cobalt-precorrin-6A reductase